MTKCPVCEAQMVQMDASADVYVGPPVDASGGVPSSDQTRHVERILMACTKCRFIQTITREVPICRSE